jgi:hypothetical protein
MGIETTQFSPTLDQEYCKVSTLLERRANTVHKKVHPQIRQLAGFPNSNHVHASILSIHQRS